MKCIIDNQGQLQISEYTQTCQLIVLEQHDYQLLAGALTEFDLEVFSMVNGSILLSFFVGHAGGRLVKWFGKK
ncbi:hypothetical protein [Motilimonas pumila]|uniref:Uncharacterized protein n=1 Tax=Motilimonas pumila TaxID=2303987 RepID=A0A418Y9C4_9GAMM|nr:hypothetical protein [Motilimonas pumila]RJG36969.1 hypothetical protein D1Z90_20075 [Motilimonas pumila]